MTDYSQAAQNNLDVRLRNGDIISISYNPAGQNGWLDSVIIGYDNNDNPLAWNLYGTSLSNDRDEDIVGLFQS